MTDRDWKSRAVGCESEAKRLAGDLEHTKAELERVTGYVLETRSHIQAAAMWYRTLEDERKRIPADAPYIPRPVDYRAKQMDCRRLFDVIEAIEAKQRKALEEVECDG